MLATELIASLIAAVKQHGDREVVTGLDRSGYGEEILAVHAFDDANCLRLGLPQNEYRRLRQVRAVHRGGP